MKAFAVLLGALAFVCSASANNTVTLGCPDQAGGTSQNGFSETNLATPSIISGTVLCQGLDTTGLSNVTATIYLSDDLSGSIGFNSDASTATTFSSTTAPGFVTIAIAHDEATGPSYISGGQTSICSGSPSCYYAETLSSIPTSSFSINFTNYACGASDGTYTTTTNCPNTSSGNVFVQYSYTTSSLTPEPVSMLLLGSGMLALSVIGRKKLVRK